MKNAMTSLGQRLVRLLPVICLVAAAFAARPASAGDWKWGCTGRQADEQIAFNRYRLAVIAGKGPAGKLEEIVFRSDLTADKTWPGKSRTITATYQPDDVNEGLGPTLGFKASDGNGKLTLTELASKRTKRRAKLVAGCRDETREWFEKRYRLERGSEPPRTVTLKCMEYMLSTKGGRTCR